ncbi:36581_t:CDS:2 [Gigaspora margarita]|uniref:36581_t:CDS:1 n=1 Tax=Gigaspora margarita TaxID=4874 RepID=A0ABM8W0Y8_GIGMA|nr:36581_t:CDS:2 [Gigaspora margarita]
MSSQVKAKIVINSIPHGSITLDETLNVSEAYQQIIEQLGSNSNDPRYKYFFENLDEIIEHDKQYSTKLKLSEIIDHNSSIIHLKRVLKIKVSVVGNRPIEYEFDNLDDDLFNIRKKLLQIREESIKIIPRFFKFLKDDRSFVTDFGEKHTTLGGILGTSNILRISLDEKKELINNNSSAIVTIHKHLHSGGVDKYTERLSTNRKLDYVRSILKMGPNLVFYHIDEKINRLSEISTDWADIAWVIDDKLQLKICQEDDKDWNKLIEQCDMGFTYENENIKFATSQAFTINVTRITPVFNHLYSGTLELICEQRFDSLFKECLIVNGEITETSPLPYLPYLSLFVGISYNKANELYKSRNEATRYSCEIISKAKLRLDKQNIILNKDFINEIESALNNKYTNNKKINELRKIFQKYGHFYASEVIYGGAIIENSRNINTRRRGCGSIGVVTNNNITVHDNFQNMTSELLDISKKTLTIVGGNEAFYIKDNPEASRSWRSSVKNSKYWRIISYNIRPIIDLLDDNLKNKILEIFGKKILKAEITTHPTSLRNLCKDPIIIDDLSNIFKELTSNPSQCQIFASIMNQDDRIYSLRVDYVDENSPVFVVHYVGNKKKLRKKQRQLYKIRISWIIVGYPEKFMFELRNSGIDVTICEKKLEEMERVDTNNNCSYKCTIDSSPNTTYSKLGISVIHSPTSSRYYNPYKSIIIGTHFRPDNTVCLFVRNLDSNSSNDNILNEIPLLKIVYSIINMGDNKPRLVKVKWNNKNPNMFFNPFSKDNSKKLMLFEEDGTFRSILENCVRKKSDGDYELGCPLLINIMNGCEYHGFVNINRKSPLYHSMNHSSSTNSEFEGFISYFIVAD